MCFGKLVVETRGGVGRQEEKQCLGSVTVSPHKKLCPSDRAPAGTADAPPQTAGVRQLDGPGREGSNVWYWVVNAPFQSPVAFPIPGFPWTWS